MNTTTRPREAVISVADFCSTFGISVPTASRWIANGTVASIKLGKRRLIPSSEVDRLIRTASRAKQRQVAGAR